MSRRDEQRLEDILRAIESILEHCPDTKVGLQEDEPLQSHVKLKLLIIGEATSSLSPAVKEHASDVPWREIVGMRNILVHEYESVDLDILWDVVENELPELQARIEELLERFRGDEPPAAPRGP